MKLIDMRDHERSLSALKEEVTWIKVTPLTSILLLLVLPLKATSQHWVVRGLGQVAKPNGTRAEMRMPCAFRTGKLGKDCVDGKVERVVVRRQ